jgi:hypothetical protein
MRLVRLWVSKESGKKWRSSSFGILDAIANSKENRHHRLQNESQFQWPSQSSKDSIEDV